MSSDKIYDSNFVLSASSLGEREIWTVYDDNSYIEYSFDNLDGGTGTFWHNDPTRDFVFSGRTGVTPSAQSGPTASIEDYYIYTEASSQVAGDVAIVSSSVITITDDYPTPYLEFFYHVTYDGASTNQTLYGSLSLQVATASTAVDSDWDTIWEISGTDGTLANWTDPWQGTKVYLTDYKTASFYLRFRAEMGDVNPVFCQDMCIDHLYIYNWPPITESLHLPTIGRTNNPLSMRRSRILASAIPERWISSVPVVSLSGIKSEDEL